MKNLSDYMNDPSIANEPMPNRELYAIRLMIYDETKDMSQEEMMAYYRKIEQDALMKYNIQFAN